MNKLYTEEEREQILGLVNAVLDEKVIRLRHAPTIEPDKVDGRYILRHLFTTPDFYVFLNPCQTDNIENQSSGDEAMSTLKIEKNVPMPGRIGMRKNERYPFDDMRVGDSFVIKGNETKRSSVHSCARKRGYRVVTRKVGNNKYRIWMSGKVK